MQINFWPPYQKSQGPGLFLVDVTQDLGSATFFLWAVANFWRWQHQMTTHQTKTLISFSWTMTSHYRNGPFESLLSSRRLWDIKTRTSRLKNSIYISSTVLINSSWVPLPSPAHRRMHLINAPALFNTHFFAQQTYIASCILSMLLFCNELFLSFLSTRPYIFIEVTCPFHIVFIFQGTTTPKQIPCKYITYLAINMLLILEVFLICL